MLKSDLIKAVGTGVKTRDEMLAIKEGLLKNYDSFLVDIALDLYLDYVTDSLTHQDLFFVKPHIDIGYYLTGDTE